MKRDKATPCANGPRCDDMFTSCGFLHSTEDFKEAHKLSKARQAEEVENTVKQKINRLHLSQDSGALTKVFSHQDPDVDYTKNKAFDSKQKQKMFAPKSRQDSDDEEQ